MSGGSGEGKTTILSVLSGLLTPTTGGVRVLTADGVNGAEEARKGGAFSVQFQRGFIEEHWTVKENAARFAADEQRVAVLLEQLGLASIAERRGANLSGGERKRVGLARALASNNPILILDEPLAELDQAWWGTIDGILAEEVARGRVVVCASHLPMAVAEGGRKYEVSKQ